MINSSSSTSNYGWSTTSNSIDSGPASSTSILFQDSRGQSVQQQQQQVPAAHPPHNLLLTTTDPNLHMIMGLGLSANSPSQPIDHWNQQPSLPL